MNIYEYVRPLGAIQDNNELRDQFISIYDQASHHQMALFCIEYMRYLHQRINRPLSADSLLSIEAIKLWIEGKAHYQQARSISGDFNALAKKESDPILIRLYRTCAQLSAVPHVKYHALWATDYAITMFNRIAPNDQHVVTHERQHQIDMLKAVMERTMD